MFRHVRHAICAGIVVIVMAIHALFKRRYVTKRGERNFVPIRNMILKFNMGDNERLRKRSQCNQQQLDFDAMHSRITFQT